MTDWLDRPTGPGWWWLSPNRAQKYLYEVAWRDGRLMARPKGNKTWFEVDDPIFDDREWCSTSMPEVPR